MQIKWPNNKDFAFTIIDDTDEATVNNLIPIYNFLYKLKIFATKTVWIEPSRDKFTGDYLKQKNYLDFILDIKKKGYEIAFHGVGSGDYQRKEILEGLEFYKENLGSYPNTLLSI